MVCTCIDERQTEGAMQAVSSRSPFNTYPRCSQTNYRMDEPNRWVKHYIDMRVMETNQVIFVKRVMCVRSGNTNLKLWFPAEKNSGDVQISADPAHLSGRAAVSCLSSRIEFIMQTQR